MKTYHVGGLNPIRRVKTFEEALAQAKDDDTIELHKNIIESAKITKNLIIKGNGNTWTTPNGQVAIVAEAPIELSNLTIKVPPRSIGLSIKNGSHLEKLTLIQEGPIREFYPSVQLLEGAHKIFDSNIMGLNADAKAQIEFKGCTFSSYYKGDVLLSDYADMSKIYGPTTLTDCTLSSVQLAGPSTLNECVINKYVDIHADAMLNHPTFDIIPATVKKNWAKKEPDNGPLSHAIDIRYGLLVDGATVTINGYETSNLDKDFQMIYGLNATLTVNKVDRNIADDIASSTLSKSSITFSDVNDTAFWYLDDTKASFVRSKVNSNQTHESAKEKLDKMIGLDSVKRKIESMVNTIQMNRGTENSDFEFAYNMIFAGNPGTGKSVVAKIFAETLFEIGVIPENKFTTATSDELVKGFVGQTGGNTRKILDKALGGVLFIDEAYELADKGSGNSFNSEVISVLIRYMEAHRSDLVVIAAGYTKEMQDFLASNPGLGRRFDWVEFKDYTPLEMTKIFEQIRESYGDVYATQGMPELVNQLFTRLTEFNLTHPDAKGRVTNGGNGGLARNAYQSVIEARNNRVMQDNGTPSITREDLMAGFVEEANKAARRLLPH